MRIKTALFALIALLALAPHSAFAQAKNTFDLTRAPQYQVYSAPETDLPIHIKPGKYQTVPIPEELGTAVVDDGASKITAVPYANKQVALYPHGEGAAHVTLYGKNGKVLMARYVVVATPEVKYIRLHRICKKGQTGQCEKTDVYYCPNLCYESRVINPQDMMVSK